MLDDFQEDVLESMMNLVEKCSRWMTAFAFLASAAVLFCGSSAGHLLWKVMCITHGIAFVCNACAHIFLGGDKKSVLEARCLAALNIVALIAVVVKFG